MVSWRRGRDPRERYPTAPLASVSRQPARRTSLLSPARRTDPGQPIRDSGGRVDPGPPARGQPRSLRHAVRMPHGLPGDVNTRGPYMSPREGLHEIPTCPRDAASWIAARTASTSALRMSDCRNRVCQVIWTRSEEHTSELQSLTNLV